MKSIKLIIIFLIALILAGSMQSIYDSNRNYLAVREAFVSLPSAKTLKIVSFGFQDLLADLLYIWAIQFYSNYTIKNRFEFIEPVFNLITDLSPYHKDIYHIGSVIMIQEKGDYDMGIRLLQKGAENMPKDYFFNYTAGIYSLFDQKNPEKARPFFDKVLQIKSISPQIRNLVKNMRAYTIYSLNNLEEAYNEWLKIYNSDESFDFQKDTAKTHLYNIKAKIDLPKIREAIKLYYQKFGNYPKTLQLLKTSGFLWEIPLDFFGSPYIYSRKSGTVKSERSYHIFSLRRK
jgi:tetratricopeptide (TPR) repeat protein